ncbi:MAG: proton-conducting transporter membrane subunit [Haloferacaceae archaeon]
MTRNTASDEPAPLPESPAPSVIGRLATRAVWALFGLSLVVLAFSVVRDSRWALAGVVAVDGLTAVMWVVVTFFGGVVHSYARRYVAGEPREDAFFAKTFAFTLAVMVLVAADHVALFAAAWLAMGLVMASLVGHVEGWPQARAAARTARRHFLASSALLTVGLAALAAATGQTGIQAILARVGDLPQSVALLAAGALLLAAVVQSALFPFQRWLFSSMTAPTPASALMHAGFVNAGGVLLTRFAPLFVDRAPVMAVVAVVGAASALLGQATIQVQTDVKRELAASTTAQMGFMILQCGLGFFAAAITHLILHGFYKAYLFLSSGAGVERAAPSPPSDDGFSPVRAVVSLATALAGGALFAVLTGKGTALDSGLVLVVVVVLTTLHATRDVLGKPTLRPGLRIVGAPLVVVAAVGGYAVLFEAISAVMADVPATSVHLALTPVHVVVAGAFALAYLAAEFDLHRASGRLYVTLLNLAQPDPTTVLTSTEEYDDA